MRPLIQTTASALVFAAMTLLACGITFGQTGWKYQPPQVRSERISPNLKIQNPIRFTSSPKKLVNGSGFGIQEGDELSENLDQDSSDAAPQDSISDLELVDDDQQMDDVDDDERPARPEFGAWPKKGIRGIVIDVREKNYNAPEDMSAQLIASSASQWTQFAPAPKVFAWVAPDIRYQPLYFEDVALERYGQTAPPYKQGLASGFHFFKSVVSLPRQMRYDAPRSCDHPLGFCRPGNKVPYTIQRHWFQR